MDGSCIYILSVFLKDSGSHLLSHVVSNIVPSAVWVLTIVFGMRTGVSPRRIATGNFVFSADSVFSRNLHATSRSIALAS